MIRSTSSMIVFMSSDYSVSLPVPDSQWKFWYPYNEFFIVEGGDNSVIPLSIGLPVVIVFCVLLLLFIGIIIVLLRVVLKRRKQRHLQLTAIPQILQQRAITNTKESYHKKRPKSTNLEFLHATNDNKYNIAVSRGDVESRRPLMDPPAIQNEYVHCSKSGY